MAEIEVYTRSLCGYCTAAKKLLKEKGAEFVEKDGSSNVEIRQEMMTRSGRTTFPQIFIDGKHIGGCDDLFDLEDEDKLDALLAG